MLSKAPAVATEQRQALEVSRNAGLGELRTIAESDTFCLSSRKSNNPICCGMSIILPYPKPTDTLLVRG
jgi:hypothetical protein